MGHSDYPANTPSTISASETQNIEVYIGVFFDGTNNNMNRYSFAEVRKKLERSHTQKYEKPTQGVVFGPLYKLVEKLPNGKEIVEQAKRDENNYKEETAQYLSQSDEYKKKLSQSTSSDSNAFEGSSYEYKNEKLSNVAFLTSLYVGKKDGKTCNLYIEGAGATAFNDSGDSDKIGLAFGIGETGVVALVSKAVKFVSNYLNSLGLTETEKSRTIVHFDVFGFSRGATCARLFSNLVANESIKRKFEFGYYLDESHYSNGEIHFIEGFKQKTVDFLGIYDTVASIGLLKLDRSDEFHSSFINEGGGYVNSLYGKLSSKAAKKSNKEQTKGLSDKTEKLGPVESMFNYRSEEFYNNFHCDNVVNYGLDSTKLIGKVLSVFHIGALDEYRENFAFTTIGEINKIYDNCLEILVPGCHSDIGGGYVDDDKNLVTLYKKKPIKGSQGREGEKAEYTISIYPLSSNRKGNEISVSVDSLKKLGWILEDSSNLVSSLKDNIRGKIGLEATSEQSLESVNFWNNPNSGYSNITLHMMLRRAQIEINSREIFDFDVTSPHPRINIPKKLKKMSAEMVSFAESGTKGNRYSLCPGGSYDSLQYQKLRRDFIHFTSTDKWNWGFHKNNLGNILDANAPNRKDGKVICRIVYNTNDSNLHYMQDMTIDHKEIINYE